MDLELSGKRALITGGSLLPAKWRRLGFSYARRTLFDKIWDKHVVTVQDDGTALLYVDRHFVIEVTSAQAYEGLRLKSRGVWRPMSIVATADHNPPTRSNARVTDPVAQLQLKTLDDNVKVR